MKNSSLLLAAGFAVVASAASAEPARMTGTVTDVFGPRFVLDTASGKVLVEIGPKGADKVTVKIGEKVDIEGDRRLNEVRATRITLPDGHAYQVGRAPGESWREWLTGKPPTEASGPFGADEARKLATNAGYNVTADPVRTKEHFKVMASKDGKDFELRVHSDGNIESSPAFGVADAKKLAAAKGYQLTGEPVAMKEHFRVTATKDGKPYEIDLHRDGKVVEFTPFSVLDAQRLAKDKGYEVVGDTRAVDEHFELLGKKDGAFHELDAHRDGNLVTGRRVEAGDPKWGSLVR